MSSTVLANANAKDKPHNPYINPPNLATREATLNTTSSASRLAYGWRKLKRLPPTLARDEIEGQNLEEYIISMGAFCSSHAIPHDFDENLKTTKEDDNHCCATSTLVKYIGQHFGASELKLLAEMKQDLDELKQSKNDVMLELATQKQQNIDQSAIIEKQTAELARLRAENDELVKEKKQLKLAMEAMMHTPERKRPRPCTTVSSPLALGTDLNEEVVGDIDLSAAAAAAVPAGISNAETTTVASVSLLSYNNDAYANAEMSGNAKESFGDVLRHLSEIGWLSISDEKFQATAVPVKWKANKQLLHNCIELAAFAASGNDMKMLVSKKDAKNNALDAAALKTIAMRIEKATHNKLLEFEGSSYEVNKNAPKPKTAYVTGMGARIRGRKE